MTGTRTQALLLTALLCFLEVNAFADTGYYVVTQLSITNATHPSINNSGEIVWAVQNSTGILSNVRGQLSASGVSPHLANSGEVVYADTFTANGMDLVSTTRGRLTFGGIIDLGFSDFDINSNGEVVYVALDNNNLHQVYSTVRGQVTFDLVDHYNPCINDLGEILWNRYGEGPGLVSSTRGPIPGFYPTIYAVNNYDEFCYEGILMSGSISTSPHLFSNLHGVAVNDPNQYQFYGGINDTGTLVWAQQSYTDFKYYIYEATWISSPSLTITGGPSSFTLQWPTNSGAFQAQYTTNLASTNWLALPGSPATNSGTLLQSIPSSILSPAFFRLSNTNP